ncbi:homoaconitase [Microbotryum lychnidis-dioicae p1A1 Lamole]|uniref:Homoaconitase, mitochondrial n=1 Tax=Microbotryum lychnidis-dioicae (strain p1A1 Lamole / MvSl-1064) TaxID=683840 RepID=U5H163_USTV1|nr:homoaconitase [Microbotryum lychnidis-dioicae p1A1 Lamole]|eukprot:KDE08666.1 homoaconitase [Microbotryum lychnidis-dioicae p1A1 Lamole]
MLARRAPYSSHIVKLHSRRAFATQASIPQTYVEKIVQRHAVGLPEGKVVRAGDYVMIKPQHVMTHDNTGPVISKFKSIGASKISNPRQTVFTLDHDVQNRSKANLAKYSKIESFAGEHDVDFYPAGRGIGHQIMIEEGYAFPGVMTVASDSHSNMYGGVGCVGTAIVRTDAAALWATQRTWWQVPPIVRVNLEGELPLGVTGKDIIIALCGSFNKDEVLNHAIEFGGSGVAQLSVDERLAISNMTTEWGALVGVFPVDSVLQKWYDGQLKKAELRKFQFAGKSSSVPTVDHPRLTEKRLAEVFANPIKADEGATYTKTLTLHLPTLSPSVAGPNSVKVATPLPTLEEQKIKINKAYLVSCTNSRASDLQRAAEVMKGKKLAPGVEFYIAAASSVVQQESEAAGDWAALVAAGAKVLPAGCGPCIGLGTGLLEDGEVGISATNRNYKGRMGSPKALAYLASPEVVAASAIAGHICGPRIEGATPSKNEPKIDLVIHTSAASPAASEGPAAAEPLLPSFPPLFSGPLIFAPQDNLNTDGIYPGKYTYQDDITLEKQAEVVMENYDVDFASLMARIRSPASETRSKGRGVVLASGYNFGTGSSREQAATALLSSGVPLVLCGSFGDIFKRNSINNALICVECPELIEDLTRDFGKDGKRNAGGKDGKGTVETEYWVEVGSGDGKVTVKDKEGGMVIKEYKVGTVGTSVQELWLAGGLEGWVRERI